jgi:hypothetical protein
LRDAIQRNNQRTGKQKIPVPAIAGAFRKLQPPRPEEGFDDVYSVNVAPEGGFVITKRVEER